MRILIVEDEAHIQMVMRKILTRLGQYEVIVSEDAEAGLEMVRAGTINLVVMDVSLEQTQHHGQPLDGVGYARLLKADPATRAVPVLLATAHALPGDAERLMAASGADAYIAKPFVEPIELVNIVRRLLDQAA